MKSWLIANPLPRIQTSCNKDLNGGYETLDDVGTNIIAKLMGKVKKKNIKLPVLALCYLGAILEEKKMNTNTAKTPH